MYRKELKYHRGFNQGSRGIFQNLTKTLSTTHPIPREVMICTLLFSIERIIPGIPGGISGLGLWDGLESLKEGVG